MRPFGGTLRGSLICNLRTENEAGAFDTQLVLGSYWVSEIVVMSVSLDSYTMVV